MNEKVSKVVTSVKEYWGNQTKNRKIAYISGLAAVVIAAVIITAVLNHKEYVVLFEGLETAEATEIVSLIQAEGTEVVLKSGGTILVPDGTQDTLTMSLATQGYPKSNLTYDLYTSNVGMFTTESEKKTYERMALESRLSAIVGSCEGIQKAVVTLSIPERKNTVIEAYQLNPSASVVVYPEKNTVLTNDQIEGITHIVQMSYAGLTPENISITDNYGTLLIAGEENVDVIAQETRKLKFKTDLETQIRQKIESLLVNAYGEDGFSAAVNMVLNFDAKVSEDTRYTPSTDDGRGMLQHADGSDASGTEVVDGGVVGVEVNADDTFPTGDTNGGGNWTENSFSNTYLVNTYKEQVEKEGYTIDGLSVSVIIYTDYLPESTRQELVNLVANAATVRPEVANDVVTVTNLPKYEDVIAAEAETKYLFGLSLSQLVILGAILLGILLILILVLVSLTSKAKKKRKKFESTILEAQGYKEGEELTDSFFVLGGDAENPADDTPSLLGANPIDSKEAIIRKELTEFSHFSPDIVAQLLRVWLKEE
ncbi:MAG: flagellar basal-body MS-ring/collar protein FliF [Huintestinicola sp.]